MKKIYSFVLMAAMLLVGTSVMAGRTVEVWEDTELIDAFADAQDGDVIEVKASIPSVGSQLVLNVDGYVVLKLNGYTVTMTYNPTKDDAEILIKRGRLEIINGTIATTAAHAYDLIRLNGGGASTQIDAKVETPYSQVIVNAGVIIRNGVANAISITEATGTNNLANGARLDVYGELDAQKYGIKVNGSVVPPTNTNHSPYVYIHTGANVHTNNTATKAVAAYSSGYARWRIEGTCQGSTGLYAKGGQVEIVDNAIIQSNNDNPVTTQTGGSSGVNAGGSAIVVESNENYPGFITVTISGNAQVNASSGYAIEETIAEDDHSQVDLISIQGGVIQGGDKGAIIVEEETTDGKKVTVVGGNIEGTLAIEGATETTKVTVEEFITAGTSTTNPEAEADFLVVKGTPEQDPANPNATYTVTPNLSKVITLNADGYTTFSAAYVRSIDADDYAAGLKAYYAEYKEVGGEQTLELHELDNDHVIPVGIGVVFKGAANQSYSLLATGSHTTGTDYTTVNALSAATAWSANEAVNGIIAGDVHANAYVLSGSMMYKYEGANMKANKAYLDLGSAPAPKRIKMVFAETQDIENVEFEAVKAVKFIENGQVLIKRGENIYNVQGQIVK